MLPHAPLNPRGIVTNGKGTASSVTKSMPSEPLEPLRSALKATLIFVTLPPLAAAEKRTTQETLHAPRLWRSNWSIVLAAAQERSSFPVE